MRYYCKNRFKLTYLDVEYDLHIEIKIVTVTGFET